MNLLGLKRQAFLFGISFDLNNNFVIPASELAQSGVCFHMPASSFINLERSHLPDKLIFEKFSVEQQEFSESFSIVKKHLDFGNSYLVNLTKPTEIHTNLNFQQIFEHSKAPYKLLIDDKIVVFSPEIFIRAGKGRINSFPMKGTIDASIPNAAEIILNDFKETAEHNTIVDLIRNDLSMISKNVIVKRFRYIDTIITHKKNLLQVSSEVEGQIGDGFFDNLGSNIFTILPAGSISGAPKRKTVEIIKEAEKYDRGLYTGVFGYFDGEYLDSAVMIRFMEKKDGKVYFKSGGGITTMSQCKSEYDEMVDKVYLPIY